MDDRSAALPLLVCDPFYSVWLTGKGEDAQPVHWSGRPFPLSVRVSDGSRLSTLIGGPDGLPRIPCVREEFFPTRTVLTFEEGATAVRLTFFNPCFPEDLSTVTLPVGFVFSEILKGNGQTAILLSVGASAAGSDRTETVRTSRLPGYAGTGAALLEPVPNIPLSRSGDMVTADWGSWYLVHPSAAVAEGISAVADAPSLEARASGETACFLLAFDDGIPARFLGEETEPYWKRFYPSFEEMVASFRVRAEELRRQAESFDAELLNEAGRISPSYAYLASLAFRQAVGAHKLVTFRGETLFLSKECASNGCGATLDVTYPSIPLFLKYNPALVRAMVRPILLFARSGCWHFPFSPHDCGQYPLLDGQAYGRKPDGSWDEDLQMPVEECGNALLCLSAAFFADGDRTMQGDPDTEELLDGWADYLIEAGYDPANQLCTDDFAGHMAHNCNLSLKSILALASYGRMTGKEKYADAAARMAKQFAADARRDVAGSRLSFADDAGWSLKYNLVWDELFGFDLFSPAFRASERRRYAAEARPYGTPLDSRSTQTKLDWLVWSAVLCGGGYARETYDRIRRMIADTPDPYPLTDWYDTVTARSYGFRARSVVGGVFLPLLTGADFPYLSTETKKET